ncbi:hypothetical protein IGI39_000368 [Enterococcus sp. AZ135]|uniref:DUF443 family protein n=1 Tax=unclassified Enterococcus TaxID=2608891 RepID=UPI003F1F825C
MYKKKYGTLEDIKGEYRTKLLTMNDHQYYVDLDCNPIFPIFPFLVFLLPVKAYKIENGFVKNTILHESISVMAGTGVSVVGSRLLYRLIEYTNVTWKSNVKLILALLVILSILFFRIYSQIIKKERKLDLRKNRDIIIRPKRKSRRIGLFLVFLVYYGMLLTIFIDILKNGNLIYMGLGIILFYMSTGLHFWVMKAGDYEIKFLEEELK